MTDQGKSIDYLLIFVSEWTSGDWCAHVTLYARACVRACVGACVRGCVGACVRARACVRVTE